MRDWIARPGRLTIGLPQGGNVDDRPIYRLDVYDETSGVQLLELVIPVETMALALSSRAHLPITHAINPRAEQLAGATKEHKTIPCWVPRVYASDMGTRHEKPSTEAARLRECVAYYEVDGWGASLSDLTNGHRTSDEKYPAGVLDELKRNAKATKDEEGRVQHVTFHRFVRDGNPVILQD